jgi:hypothetical protein
LTEPNFWALPTEPDPDPDLLPPDQEPVLNPSEEATDPPSDKPLPALDNEPLYWDFFF